MTTLQYRPPEAEGAAPFVLVARGGSAGEQRFPFVDRIEIGRFEPGVRLHSGRLLVDDPTVSAIHCVIVRGSDGRLFARDTSRNGTRLDGTRLIPNREQEIRPGQTLSVGSDVALLLLEDAAADFDAAVRPTTRGTVDRPSTPELAVLVGDVRGYTSLLAAVPGAMLQAAVMCVFARLTGTIRSLGGQVKEYQGDSVLAFWERTGDMSPAVPACRAALAVQREVELAASDAGCWPFHDRPLRMDWAVTTGRVSVRVLGEDRPEELSLVGEPVVLAYRLEKAAGDRIGSPLACARTRAAASGWFEFGDVGTLTLAGFDTPVPAFRLVGEMRNAAGVVETQETRILR